VNEGEEISYPDIPITDPEQLPYIQKLDQVSFKAHLESVLDEPMHPQIETAIEQYCWSSLCASASEVSAAAGLNFYAAEFGNIALLPGGNAKVSETIVEKLYQSLPENHLRANSLVFDVEVGKDGVRVAYLDGTGKIQSLLAQSVVMACPKFVAAKLINDLEPERIAAIAQLRYRSYLVANVCLNGPVKDPFYDLYLLGSGELQGEDARSASQKQKVTDVIVADYASRKPGSDHSVLTLYRGLPYDGARAELFAPDAYQTYKQQFEQQVTESILPMLKISKDQVADLRMARWGHPLVVPKPGQITSNTVNIIRKPFRDQVFFVEQDNWMLPAFETSVTEALLFEPKIRAALKR
ncbi:MAG: FAD-dependent oxidoreductase, partial [Lysobacterales bacterium]